MRILIEAENATVAVADGVIVEPQGSFDHEIRLPAGEVRPGLVNAHDHLHRNHYGRLGRPPYANAYEWAEDIRSRHADEIAKGRRVPRRAALLAGAWKNLVAGVTHVVHHDAWEGDFEREFPLTVVRIANADSLGMTPEFSVPKGKPFALHVAEGVDDRAALEIHALEARKLLGPGLMAVHAVGADPSGIEKLRATSTCIVWCPTSNHFLFGRTLRPELLADDVQVLIGSDSLLTAAGTLLDELQIARQFMSTERIADAIGPLAARTLGFAAPSLTPGSRADIALFRRPLAEANIDDVALVMAGGHLRVLDPQLAADLNMHDQGGVFEWRGLRRWIGEDTSGASQRMY